MSWRWTKKTNEAVASPKGRLEVPAAAPTNGDFECLCCNADIRHETVLAVRRITMFYAMWPGADGKPNTLPLDDEATSENFLKSLQAGLIPALPAGLLPSNFPGFPTGGQYSPTPGTPGAPVQIVINAPGGNPRDIVNGLRDGFRKVNFGRNFGFD